jgi:hypothetical protein
VEENFSAAGKWIPAAYGQHFPFLTGATILFIEEALFFLNPVLISLFEMTTSIKC